MPTTPSATTTVNGSAVTDAVAVAASSSVTLALASTFGVRSVTYTIVGNSSSALTNPTITAGADYTATFTMPAGGAQGYLIETKINNGRDELGRFATGYKFRLVVGVAGSNGLVPICLGERTERGAYGWLGAFNVLSSTTATSVTAYGATGDGTTDDTTAIQAAIDAVALAGGGTVFFPAGTYSITTAIEVKSGVKLVGAGFGVSIITQPDGTNIDLVTTENFGSTTDSYDFGIRGITLNGNYLESDWNASSNTVNNASGAGLKIQGYSFAVDVEVKNVAGVGILLEDLNASVPTARFAGWNLRARTLDTGKEGVIIRGPNDGVVDELFVGRAGILARPGSETGIATSTEYATDPVDGIVLDGVNVEFSGTVHVYGCFSGTGFRTRNTCRVHAPELTSESNRACFHFATGAYGVIGQASVRANGIYHPNWSTTAPTYTADGNGLDSTWDAITVECDNLTIERALVFRSVVSGTTQVTGWHALGVVGDFNKISIKHNNSTNPNTADDYLGDGVRIVGDGNKIDAQLHRVNGDAVYLAGRGNQITFVDSRGNGGYALVRDGGATNNLWGNDIRGAVYTAGGDDRDGFNSTQGTPNGERINLVLQLQSGATAFTGTSYSTGRSQEWNLAGVVGTTRYRLSSGDTFTNRTTDGGNPTLSVAPDLAAEFAQLADTATRDYDYDPGVDGYYTLSYKFRLVTGGGSYRCVQVVQDFKRVSGVCSLEGSTVPLGTGVQTGVGVTFSIVSDDVRVTVENTTGSTLDGHYWRGVEAGDLPS